MYIGDQSVGGWPSAFWILGLVGLVWFPIWIWKSYETPADCPYINPKELAILHEGWY